MNIDETAVMVVMVVIIFATGYLTGATVEAKKAIPKTELAEHQCGIYDKKLDIFIWADTNKRRY